MPREQQKVYLTPLARKALRDAAEKYGWEMSEIVEYLVMQGRYPNMKQEAGKPT